MFLLVALMLTLCMANRAASDNVIRFQISETEERLQRAWVSFKDEYSRSYSNPEEEQRRMKIFRENFLKMESHNNLYEKGFASYKMGINQFSDMEFSELKMFTGYLQSKNTFPSDSATDFSPDSVDIPIAIDWRKEGYVTGVKDQGLCESCWAFSATGALEGQMKRLTGRLVSLSEQNLIDCSKPQGTHGCKGGLMEDAWEYVQVNGGIDLEQYYPYEAKEGKCRYKKQFRGATVNAVALLSPANERTLTRATATLGPISVAIDATESLQRYEQGIYFESNCNKTELNHAVLVVGYGTENGHDYYIVKNSWGVGWGENGYVRFARNRDNMCGIASEAMYPVV